MISAAVIAAPLSLSAARGRPRFWNAWREAVRDDLGGLGQIPLQMTGKARSVVEHAEQDRRHPLAALGEHLARAVMAVPVPQSR